MSKFAHVVSGRAQIQPWFFSLEIYYLFHYISNTQAQVLS